MHVVSSYLQNVMQWIHLYWLLSLYQVMFFFLPGEPVTFLSSTSLGLIIIGTPKFVFNLDSRKALTLIHSTYFYFVVGLVRRTALLTLMTTCIQWYMQQVRCTMAARYTQSATCWLKYPLARRNQTDAILNKLWTNSF